MGDFNGLPGVKLICLRNCWLYSPNSTLLGGMTGLPPLYPINKHFNFFFDLC